MEISYIAAPIIGALIGYSTNWIAIKMMFRPRKPIKIGKIIIPFTPGIIPKNRENIAHAISEAITKNLLTSDDLKKALLSQEVKQKLTELINSTIENDKKLKVSEVLEKNINKQDINKICDFILNKGTYIIIERLKKENVIEILSEKIKEAISDRLKGTLFSIIGSKKIIDSIAKSIEENANEYIEKNGEKVVYEILEKEINNILDTKIEDLDLDIDVSKIIINMYENIVANNIEKILRNVNIEKIIEDKINAMDMIELEKLILKVMKRELNAVINLGALIGFVLGLINIFI